MNQLDRAAEYLDAKLMDNGNYTYYDDATRSYWSVSADDLVKLCNYLDHADEDIRRDAYSHWCSSTISTELGN